MASSRAGAFDRFFAGATPSLARARPMSIPAASKRPATWSQDTMLRVWRNWDRVSRLENPDAWARTVLHNLAVGSWRRRRTRRRYALLSSVPGAQPDTDLLEIVNALASLADKERGAYSCRMPSSASASPRSQPSLAPPRERSASGSREPVRRLPPS